MPTVNVQIQTTGGVHKVTIHPGRLRIPQGTGIVIVWKAAGPATFLPEPQCFQWLTPSPAPPAVSRTDDNTLTSAPYTNNFPEEVIWEYMIGVQEGGVKIQVDPEVDNDPPAGPMTGQKPPGQIGQPGHPGQSGPGGS